MTLQRYELSVLLMLLTLILFCTPSQATLNVEQQRKLFVQAEKALAKQNKQQFQLLSKQLSHYPIAAYLEYDQFLLTLDNKSHQQVRAFLKKYQDFPFSYNLKGKWLKKLAQKKQWRRFLALYDQRRNVALKCLSFQARINLLNDDKRSVKHQKLLRDISKVWMSGYSQPEQCDLPFKYLLNDSEQPTQLVWQRIEKAFKANKASLARHLSLKLSKQDQKIVSQWYQAHIRPEQALKKLKSSKNTLSNRKIIVHSMQRLARKNAYKANQHWKVIKSKFSFNQEQIDQITLRIALSAAYQHVSQAKQWLKQLPEHVKTDKTDIWLARINIRDEDWRGLISAINQMPPHLQQDNEWQYWMARSFASLGYTAKAKSQYKNLAKKSSYYGFLAADKVGQPYVIEHKTVAKDVNEEKLLKDNVHLMRARELFYVDRTLDARREWYRGVKKLTLSQIKQVATLASKWQWHDNAIKTVAKTPHRQDYNLRFPMPFKSLVMEHSAKKNLDPAVVYGVMRRESLFDPQAGSHVGALGLMQLMPNTAKQVAKSLGLKKPKKSDILKVENNINLGTQYFKKVLSKFENNTSLAAAAYNAGPHRVKQWLPDKATMAADLWVETIPFNETRNYVQAVLAYSTIFDKALGKEVKMSDRMHQVKAQYK